MVGAPAPPALPSTARQHNARVNARSARLAAFVDALAVADIGATFNQYRCSDGDDCGPEAPAIRRDNVRAYLGVRLDAPVLLVAEAAGWRGARYSGLCLYCERQLGDDEPSLRRSSCHPLGWSEPSATVVQAAIRPWTRDVVLWNLVPTHPRHDAVAHSNRTPSRTEMRAGERFLEDLRALLRPRHVAAIGVHAARALGPGIAAVRHPSHGGAVQCTQGLRALLGDWLG